MANGYILKWQCGGGFPAGFFIVRWDQCDPGWYVLNGTGQVVETLGALLARPKNTLGQPGGDFSLYEGWIPRVPGVPEQTFNDQAGMGRAASHYQIIAHYPGAGAGGTFTPWRTLDPWTDPAWDTNPASDQFIRLKRRYFSPTVKVNLLELTDLAGDVRGSIGEVNSFTGKSYAAAMVPSLCTRTHMIELALHTPRLCETDKQMKVADIGANILYWSA
ncbi:MAG: hypothetical protein P1V51_20080 [Deltaproteobacteria bacterium]|nr:hypothetical protein [Deltaproteobacteria bacterium]